MNLDNNEIFTIPHLKLLGTSPLKPAKSTEQMTYTSSSLDDTLALTHSSSTPPVSREEGNQNKGSDKTEETAGAANINDDKVVTDVKDTTADQGEKESDLPQSTKSEPCLVRLTTENVLEVEEKNTSEQAGEAVPTVHEQSSKSEPSLVHWSAKIHTNIEAKDSSGDIESKTLPRDSEVSPSAGCTTANATPPLHAITTPPAQIDQSTATSPKSEAEKGGGVDDLQPVSGEDEKSKELAPFPQLETLSLVNNLVWNSLC